MTNEEVVLRSKFYLAPKNYTLEDLKHLNNKYTAYPGLTQEQANKVYKEIQNFKNELDPDGIAVYKNGKKVDWPRK